MIGRLAILAVLAAPSLTRLPAAGGGTVTVSADRVKYNFPKRQIDYTGNPVRLTRGDAVLTCKRLSAQLDDAENVKDATCEGEVRFERGDRIVTCEKATYEEAASRLTCEGKPVLKTPSLTATGSLLVYDLERDEVTMDQVRGDVPSEKADARLQGIQSHRKPKGGEAEK